MSKRKFKKEYKKMHKRLIRLAKQFKYWDYDFTLKILQQCLSMVRLAWENPEIALAEDINDPMNEYKRTLISLKNSEKYYKEYHDLDLSYPNAQFEAWNNYWNNIRDEMMRWWD